MSNRPRETAQTYSARPQSAGVLPCRRCGAFYLPDEDGADAHRVVFGHTPTPSSAGPAGGDTETKESS